ncbi:MAG: macro domain-containing protein [Clostridia bacterium]|nr:macro domain-containing protein [Clostridia bacterium]
MKFNVIKPKIASISADAIVLPANERLKAAPGISEAVFKAAGKKLADACEEIGYCAVGSAVPTLAYKMKANYLIHACVPQWTDGEHGEYALLASAYLSALQTADLLGCENVAVPLLASEKEGFDRALAVAAAEKTVSDFYGKNLKRIALIIRGTYTEQSIRTSAFTVYTYLKENGATQRLIDTKESSRLVFSNAKLLTLQFSEERISEARAWFRKKENINKLLACGIRTAAVLLSNNTKKKS